MSGSRNPDRGLQALAVAVAATVAAYLPTPWVAKAMAVLALASYGYAFLCFTGLPCKQRVMQTWQLCSRCLGYCGGMAASVALGIVFRVPQTAEVPSKEGAIVYLGLGFLLSLPTVVHGAYRRVRGSSDGPGSVWFLFSSGFSAGIAAFLYYLAFAALLG